MKKKSLALFSVLVVTLVLTALALIPNPIRDALAREAKANGVIQYEPMEAYDLARTVCTQCHTDERIKMYCPRCGPPFVAVVPHMQTFIENYKKTKPEIKFINITESQAVAIVQVWNALVGNWEKDFREQDILKLIGHYDRLVALYKTPVDQRPIEYFLGSKEEMKVGHMTGMDQMQRDLGKPENNPQPKAHDHSDGSHEHK